MRAWWCPVAVVLVLGLLACKRAGAFTLVFGSEYPPGNLQPLHCKSMSWSCIAITLICSYIVFILCRPASGVTPDSRWVVEMAKPPDVFVTSSKREMMVREENVVARVVF